MILLFIQSVTVVKVTNVKAAVSGKHQIPVEVVSLTVLVEVRQRQRTGQVGDNTSWIVWHVALAFCSLGLNGKHSRNNNEQVLDVLYLRQAGLCTQK